MLRSGRTRLLSILSSLVFLALGVTACQVPEDVENAVVNSTRILANSLENLVARLFASRIFAGPGQIPPADFPAYGIVAFSSRPFGDEWTRHRMLCQAYVGVLLRPAELGIPLEQQMVTVWPVDDGQLADRLNNSRNETVCDDAIGGYALSQGIAAIRAANHQSVRETSRGPYLIAWAPGASIGNPDARLLVADLSDVRTAEQARAFFILWRTDIEANPEFWHSGWSVERLRIWIQIAVDRLGMQIFSIIRA